MKDKKSNSKQEIDNCLAQCFVDTTRNNNDNENEFKVNLKDIYSTNWLLEYSSLLPNGWFPIKEVCDFNNQFKLESSFGPIPLGTIQGKAQSVNANPNNDNTFGSSKNLIRTIRVEFIGTSFSLGPLKIGMNDNGKDATGSKYYDFIHVDTDIAIARSSSGGYTILSPYNRKK